jgi:holliday junction DNA helicase RuvA
MIGWLSGVVRGRDPLAGEVVVDVGGVGYVLAVSWQTLAAVPEPGGAITLHVHTHVREDALALFGFASVGERRMFRLLLSVPQVGPKLALAVLGGLPLSDLVRAIAEQDRATLERTPGVGKRTAERILLDLHEKVKVFAPGPTDPVGTRPAAAADVYAEAQDVLVNLGWKPKPVEQALGRVAEQAGPKAALDDVVRRALAELMTR